MAACHRGKHLVEEPKKFALQPDIVITKEDKIINADTKWKIINANNPSDDDLKQMFVLSLVIELQARQLVW